jgi:hypothetical protein
MLKLFVDANIFLNFFREDMPKFHSLIEALEGMRSNLLVTERVANEVRRNKVQVVDSTLQAIRKQLEFPAIRVPSHLGGNDDVSLEGLNKDLSDAFSKIKALKERFGTYRDELVRKVARSEDSTSSALERIFADAVVPTEEQLARARERQAYGDPPGKAGDPLGDQVSWEQVLAQIRHGHEVWLVTNDRDYFDPIGETNILNPVLTMEVQRIGSAVIPQVFSKLVDAVESASVVLKSVEETLSADVDIDAIRQEEAARQDEVLKSTSILTPRILPVLAALARISQEKAENESILHHLLRNEQVDSYGEGLNMAMRKIRERAMETELSKK